MWPRSAAHNGEIRARHAMLAELPAKMARGRCGAGKNYKTAGFLVEPMDSEDFTAAQQAR